MLAIELKDKLNIQVDHAYCILGDDAYLRGEALSLLRGLAGEDFIEFNLFELDGGNASVSDIIANLSQVPFMSSRRVLVVRDFCDNISDDELEKLGNAIVKEEDNVVVFYYTSQVPNFVKKIATVVDCNKLKDGDVKSVALRWISERCYDIASTAIYKLISYTNCDLMRIKNELDKLFNYCQDTKIIDDNAVETVVSKDIEFVVFALSNAVSEKRAKDAYAILGEAKGDIGKNLGMLTTLINQFRRTLHVLLNKNDTKANLAKHLGISEYAVGRTLTLASKYKPVKLKAIVDKLEEVEYYFKSGKIISIDEALFIGVAYALENS